MSSKVNKWKSINKKVMLIVESSEDEFGDHSDMIETSHNTSSDNNKSADEFDLSESEANPTSDSDSDDDNVDDGDDDNMDDGDDGDDDMGGVDHDDVPQLHKELAACATQNRWTRSSINDLLNILRINGLDVPKDARTLLKTPTRIETYEKCGGDYAYFGISNGIRSVINEHNSNNNVLSLSINIDGVPLFRSSSKQLWPILCSFENSDIFIIAICCGDHKPNCRLERNKTNWNCVQ